MKAVIVRAERQAEIVDRLVSHVKKLDGTEVIVFPADESCGEYPARNNLAFSMAANEMQGEPFFWLEPDAIPLLSGWLYEIEKEYEVCGKEFMLSADFNHPHDLVGGIGVYGPKTAHIIPREANTQLHGCGWDTWMLLRIPQMIHFSKKIQHSYGIYNESGMAEPHRFPRDNNIIRNTALVFHRDKYQDLIYE